MINILNEAEIVTCECRDATKGRHGVFRKPDKKPKHGKKPVAFGAIGSWTVAVNGARALHEAMSIGKAKHPAKGSFSLIPHGAITCTTKV